jgi:hypothetical protein
MEKAKFFDINGARAFIEVAMQHYESLMPPWFIDWLNDLYARLHEDWRKITLDELSVLYRLSDGDEWKSEHYAANDVYRLFDRLGRSTDDIMVSY